MSLLSNSASSRDVACAAEDWKAPLLITGCPRTGTSALAQLLSTHDRICIFNEYSLYYPPAMEFNVWHRIREMQDDNPPPAKISRDMQSLRSRLVADLPATASAETTRSWLFGLLQQPVPIYGDKMPFMYLKVMEEIAARFPGVRFLVTLRDGRAVVASQIRQYQLAVESGAPPEPWMKPTVAAAEYLWLRSARRWLSLRADPPAPCLEVRYEQATKSPEGLARNICDFVGLEYRQDEFRKFLDRYRPVHADAWREEMPDIESQLSREFRDALEGLGYA